MSYDDYDVDDFARAVRESYYAGFEQGIKFSKTNSPEILQARMTVMEREMSDLKSHNFSLQESNDKLLSALKGEVKPESINGVELLTDSELTIIRESLKAKAEETK